MGILDGGQRQGHEGACKLPTPEEKIQTHVTTQPLLQSNLGSGSRPLVCSAPTVCCFCTLNMWGSVFPFPSTWDHLSCPLPPDHSREGRTGQLFIVSILVPFFPLVTLFTTGNFIERVCFFFSPSLPLDNQSHHSTSRISVASLMPRAWRFARA